MNKIFLSIILGIFLISSISAIEFSNQIPSILPLSVGEHSFKVDVKGTNLENITFSGLDSIIENGKKINFTLPYDIVSNGIPQTLTINYSVSNDFNFNFGKTYSTILKANGTNSSLSNLIVSFKTNNPIKYLDNGNLKIDIDDLSVVNGFGEDNEWYPFDEIKAEIDIENNGNDKIKNIVVEFGLYDKKNNKWIVKDEEEEFSLNDDSEKSLEILFKISRLSRIDLENTNDYIFYIWVTGYDYETLDKTSTYDLEDISLNIDSDFFILDNIQVPENSSCGKDIQITANLINIGSEEQEDVYVLIYNRELGINQKVEVGDIDSFDKKPLDVTLTLPTNITEKSYVFTMSVYNENDEIYESDNNDKSQFSSDTFKIYNCVSKQIESSEKVDNNETEKEEVFNLFGKELPKKNIYIWAIGGLNIILILIIILVAVRLVKKN